jgi:uncharacterized protein
MSQKQALVVRGGWVGHRPVEATDLFIPHLEKNGFSVRVEEDSTAVYAEADYLAGVDLVLQCMTMTSIQPDELAGLSTAVQNGTGLAGWHGGIADSYRNSSDYLHLIGGQFACHPAKPASERHGGPEDNFRRHRIEMQPAAATHPITAGLGDFELVTEQYWVLADEYNDVLATTTQAVRAGDPWHRPVTSPAIWTRRWGSGKVFVCTPGHDLDVLRQAEVSTIIERGLLWAAR